MQRLFVTSTRVPFCHELSAGWTSSPQLGARTYGIASCDPLIVMVQPTHDRKSDQLVPCILSGKNRSASLWDLLRNPLMGSCLIEVDYIRIEHAARAASHAGSADGPGMLVAHASVESHKVVPICFWQSLIKSYRSRYECTLIAAKPDGENGRAN